MIEDPEVTEYLTKIGERLTKHLPINRLRFQFFLVDLPDANAFVLPGGRIFVSRKLVAAALTEDELAGVIAHELGHLVTHESAIKTTRLFKEVLGVTSVGDRRDIFDSKKDFYKPNYYEALRIYNELSLITEDSTDLNLGITRMRFSPDGRYFVAGHHIARSFQSANAGDYSEVVDTSTFAKVSVPDSLKKLIAGGFTFVGNDRIAGINPRLPRSPGSLSFRLARYWRRWSCGAKA